MSPLTRSTSRSPRDASQTSSRPSGWASMPSGRPPVSAIVSRRRPSRVSRRMRPSSTPVRTLPWSTRTSSVPCPLTWTMVSGGRVFPAGRPEGRSGRHTTGSIGGRRIAPAYPRTRGAATSRAGVVDRAPVPAEGGAQFSGLPLPAAPAPLVPDGKDAVSTRVPGAEVHMRPVLRPDDQPGPPALHDAHPSELPPAERGRAPPAADGEPAARHLDRPPPPHDHPPEPHGRHGEQKPGDEEQQGGAAVLQPSGVLGDAPTHDGGDSADAGKHQRRHPRDPKHGPVPAADRQRGSR